MCVCKKSEHSAVCSCSESQREHYVCSRFKARADTESQRGGEGANYGEKEKERFLQKGNCYMQSEEEMNKKRKMEREKWVLLHV